MRLDRICLIKIYFLLVLFNFGCKQERKVNGNGAHDSVASIEPTVKQTVEKKDGKSAPDKTESGSPQTITKPLKNTSDEVQRSASNTEKTPVSPEKNEDNNDGPDPIVVNNLVINGWTENDLAIYAKDCQAFTEVYAVPDAAKFCKCLSQKQKGNYRLEDFKYQAKTCLGLGGGF